MKVTRHSKSLITYFKGVDDPVEIVFFGDHQPGLCNDFIKLLNGKGNSGLTEQELENLYKVAVFTYGPITRRMHRKLM